MNRYTQNHNNSANDKIVFCGGSIVKLYENNAHIMNTPIMRVKLWLTQKENEIGIYVITSCQIYGAENSQAYHDNSVIAEHEFNYSDGNVDAEVKAYISEKYGVSPSIVDVCSS